MAAVSHSTPDTQFRVGSSLQAGLYARTPVQSGSTLFSVTINLSPTRKGTTNRHWQQPLVTGGIRERYSEVLKYGPDYGYTERTVLVSAVSYTQLPRFRRVTAQPISKSHLTGWLFVYRSEITARTKGSQEDPVYGTEGKSLNLM